jgi:hypothetical protein
MHHETELFALKITREVLGSTLSPGTEYPDIFLGFPQFIQANAGRVNRSGYGHSVPIHLSSVISLLDAV